MLRPQVFPVLCLFAFTQCLSAQELADNSFDLGLQALLNIEVTSVAKQRQALSNSAAAIYVVTNEDIIRSGATSIPQAIRDVPGLHVGQIDSEKWAVSSRGFNGRYNNKLLVLMDGRALYSPEFSGVYWELQDTLMADIERIEIIRGPGAAMWGANAVNGVINIITKNSSETLGAYAEAGAGDYEKGFAGFRYGAKVADNVTARMYLKGFARDSLAHRGQDMDAVDHAIIQGVDTANDWSHFQAGIRLDAQIGSTATFIFNADIYKSDMHQIFRVSTLAAPFRRYISDSIDNNGGNVSAKYTRALSGDSEFSFQAYYDHVSRDEELFGFKTDTLDLDFQHQFVAWKNHGFVWGLGYRRIGDDISLHPTIVSSRAPEVTTKLWSAFIRDEFSLLPDRLWLTLAARVEHNGYTGFELQPNARLMWRFNDRNKLWASIARAVRTPSRAENNININAFNIPPTALPTPLIQVWVTGQDDFDSEEVISYEAGYRIIANKNLSFDSSIFYNDYNKLRGASPGALDFSGISHGYLIQPLLYTNDKHGFNYGYELSSQWVASDTLHLKLNYGYVHSQFGVQQGSISGDLQTQNTDAPKHILSAHASWNPSEKVNFDLTWRYVDNVEILDFVGFSGKQLGSYHGFDLGLRWKPTPALSIAAYGKNLLGPDHVEFEAELFHIPFRVGPSYYGKITFSF